MSNEYEVFTWGPHLFKGRIPEEVRLELIERARKAKTPFNSSLASIIDDVKELEEEDRNWLAVNLQPVVTDYFNSMRKRADEFDMSMNIPNLGNLSLASAWVNYQLNDEINPEHIHKGAIGFSIYLKIPEQISEERKKYEGAGFGPGAIAFRYGEFSNFSSFTKHFYPEEGDILMFPSTLHHWVVPFRSDCTRVSVAGNLCFL